MLEEQIAAVEAASSGTESDLSRIRKRLQAMMDSRNDVVAARGEERVVKEDWEAAVVELGLARKEEELMQVCDDVPCWL